MNLDQDKSWFGFLPIISNLVVIAIALAIYYVFVVDHLFPDWVHVIYWAVKIVIAFEIIIAAARSLIVSILALLSGLLILFMIQIYYITFATTADAWQLIIMSIIGFVITVLVRII